MKTIDGAEREPLGKLTVVVLDADETAKDYLCDALALAGYETVAESGMAGIARLLTTIHVDLVLVCAKSATENTRNYIANIRSTWNGPIFVLSAEATLNDEVELLDGGADAWLPIPFRLRELLAMMNALLRLTQPLEHKIDMIPQQDLRITQRQREVLQYIVRHSRESGHPPTIAELQNSFGFKSPNSVTTHVRALQAKGCLEKRPRTARGLILSRNLLSRLAQRSAQLPGSE